MGVIVMVRFLKLLLFLVVLFAGNSAFAAPVVCSPGYQDSTCLTPLHQGPIPAPTCQSGAGWTTVSSAVWQGSHWSQPQCAYQNQPVCQSGYTTVSAASWTGSGWTQPVCVPPQPQTPPPLTGVPACDAAAVSNGFQITQQFGIYYGNYPYTGGVGVEGIMFGANGPVVTDTCGDTTSFYELECILKGDGTFGWLSVVQAFFPGCNGGGN